MNDRRRELDELAARLRDGLLSNEERERLEQSAATDEELADALQRDEQLDEALRKAFGPPPATFRGETAASLSASSDDPSHIEPSIPSRPGAWSRRRVATLALAAAVAWALVGWQWFAKTRHRDIAFRQRPLTEIYENCVAEGFQPYWVCEDDAVFAETFRRRQGVPLQLLELPEGSAMAGLSYLAGLSRDSTSMLARVDGRPVIVVVDRLDNDWRPPTGHDAASDLYVFRQERAGLAFYEITPFAAPRLLEYFQPLSDAKSNE